MRSVRRIAFLLALSLPALPALFAQSSSSSSNPATPDQDQAQAQAQSAGQATVQARIRARREKRRADAVHEVYDHLYDLNVGMGYARFTPGPKLQRVMLYAWDVGFTRYFDERLGVTVEGRGYYGTPFVGLNPSGITKPAISAYSALIGPTYRFYLQPKYSISGRALGGYVHGNFSGDTNGFGGTYFGMYPDSGTYALSGAVNAEYNVTPTLGLRVAPEVFVTGFNSTMQTSLGFTGGLVYRFGKQR